MSVLSDTQFWHYGNPYVDSKSGGLWRMSITQHGINIGSITGFTKAECEARARLIVGAPKVATEFDALKAMNIELLLALKNIYKEPEKDFLGDRGDWIDCALAMQLIAEEAIVKAKVQ